MDIELSAGVRVLSYHGDERKTKAGATFRMDMEYGDPFDSNPKIPYDYFTCSAEFNLMKTQPLLSRVEVIGQLLSKELIDNTKCNLSVGLFQHFDFFDSDTISQYVPNDTEPCVVPYKLGTPACVGVGSLFRYQNGDFKLQTAAHLNAVFLGGILSDYYRYYHRNYNWATGYFMKLGLKGSCLQDRLSFSGNSQFYKFRTRNTLSADTEWTDSP